MMSLRLHLGFLGCLALLWGGQVRAVTTETTSSFAITSITVAGTNLVLTAVVPAGPEQIVLETRETLMGTWEEAASLTVPAGNTDITFTIPLPSTPTAFFRLEATASLPDTQPAVISSEVQYVAIPSLGLNLGTNGDAIFHFTGRVDGSDRLLITHAGARWDHVNWGWPEGAVLVNSNEWNPAAKNYLTTTGGMIFLPEQFSLTDVQLETIQGRDVVALERTNDAVMVYLDDTGPGTDMYEFKIHFHPASQPPPAAPSSVATLKIAGRIDGSDRIRFTATEATWEHKTWSYPGVVTLNGVPWYPQAEPVRQNSGTNQFLPAGIDFSSAKIVRRQGRDVATVWADKDSLQVSQADNPNGDDEYELDISFGQ